MLIGDMDIARIMIRVVSPGSRRIMGIVLPSNRNERDLLHHLLVHLHQRINVSTIVNISKLNLLILKVA
ncbi:hypothetical protein H5410_013532 [Solanum commersonii]|uniref:Uncharacterized protein n=1 Tax=Solanum commersonii TaxID=4109 RepID=A0A9J5ZNN1_SOLCO|nr:hypothetical protein H5410_013532 [Solanum commersonii]